VKKSSNSSNEAAFPDSASLKEAIVTASAAERAGQAYGATGKILKPAVIGLRHQALRSEARGDRIAAHLSKGVDQLIEALFATAPGGAANEMAICAIGGYGRQELAPYSDIDLLFLYRPQLDDRLEEALNYMLYPLWDSSLKLGYAAHTPKSAIAFANEDMIARTAYLDARFLCGAKVVFDAFHTGYDKLRRKTKNQFVVSKLKEQAERQTASFETRYLVEPDIKESKGGLRDIQTIRWLYKYVYGGAIGASRAIDKIMEAQERRALLKAERFLWSVRCRMHDLRGRAEERLTFDIQPEIARRLGYADRSNMTAAERLMKHYFVNTIEIGRLTRILCARLEADRTKRLPHLPKFLPKALQKDEAPGKPNLRIRNGRLDFESATKARRRPLDLFRLFRASVKNPKLDFHPSALALVTEQVPAVTSEIRNDAVIAKLFKNILIEPDDPARVLRIMAETGLLGKYVPAFGSILGRIDYGLYRRFTMDEHVLRCISLLAQIRQGRLKDEHPITTRIVREADDVLLYYLALLLHESIWTLNDRTIPACEKLVVRVSRRLGLSKGDADLAGWAVARHLMMIRTVERRNLAESHAIASFAAKVETRARLDLMLALSVCHLRIVGHRSWDEAIRRQLSELHGAATAWIDGGAEALDRRLKNHAAKARREIRNSLVDWTDKEKDAFLNRLADAMLRSVDQSIILRFARLIRAAERDDARSAVTVTPCDSDLEAIIYTDDRQGLLSDIAGVLAARGLSVRSVQAFTTGDGKALDIFVIQSSDGLPLDDSNGVRRLHSALLAAACAPQGKKSGLEPRIGDRRSIFSVAPYVRIEGEASKEATVVEAEGLDRPGLLHELTAAISDLGVAIASAHIATYGERAVDAFYLQDKAGGKITDAKTLVKIEKSLMRVLSAGSGA